MKCLWSMTADCSGVPDWTRVFIGALLGVAAADSGKIGVGGMVTDFAKWVSASLPTTPHGEPAPLSSNCALTIAS